MKKIKYVFELIFTFILPVIAMFLCFEVKTVNTVDENNNIISVEKEFNFKDFDFFNSEEVTFFKYEYYEHDEVVNLDYNDSLFVNLNKSNFITLTDGYSYIYYKNFITDRTCYIRFDNVTGSLLVSSLTDVYSLDYSDSSVIMIRIYSAGQIVNHYDNLIKSIETKTLKENFISRLLHNLFDSIGIENNVVIEVIIIYLLLTLIMFIFWNLIYYPLTIVFNIMLWKKELF